MKTIWDLDDKEAAQKQNITFYKQQLCNFKKRIDNFNKNRTTFSIELDYNITARTRIEKEVTYFGGIQKVFENYRTFMEQLFQKKIIIFTQGKGQVNKGLTINGAHTFAGLCAYAGPYLQKIYDEANKRKPVSNPQTVYLYHNEIANILETAGLQLKLATKVYLTFTDSRITDPSIDFSQYPEQGQKIGNIFLEFAKWLRSDGPLLEKIKNLQKQEQYATQQKNYPKALEIHIQIKKFQQLLLLKKE